VVDGSFEAVIGDDPKEGPKPDRVGNLRYATHCHGTEYRERPEPSLHFLSEGSFLERGPPRPNLMPLNTRFARK
jgi:hypothetical protein